jgi:hypothetical protein
MIAASMHSYAAVCKRAAGESTLTTRLFMTIYRALGSTVAGPPNTEIDLHAKRWLVARALVLV